MLGLFAFLPVAAGHLGCGGQHIGRRNIGGPVIHSFEERQVPNSNIDVFAECAPYNYAPMTALQGKYPVEWKGADLVAGDSVAASLFQQIDSALNATLPGSAPQVVNAQYPSNDPDCWWTKTLCTTPNKSTNLAADITTLPEPNTWGFGFDDGPNCSHNALYNFLSDNNQKATMFFIGSNVVDWPLQAKRASDDGHQICVHTWSHPMMTTLSNQQVFAELYYTRQLLTDILGLTPTCWRPPYGDIDNRVRFIAQRLNLSAIVWSEDTNDWNFGTNGVTADDITGNYESIIAKAKNGEYSTFGPIVLNHELDNFTMQEMINMYPQIKANFKYIVPIATGLNITHPYAETTVTYPDFNTYIGGGHNETVGPNTTSSSVTTGMSTTAVSSTSSVAAGSFSRASEQTSTTSPKPSGETFSEHNAGNWQRVVSPLGLLIAMSMALCA